MTNPEDQHKQEASNECLDENVKRRETYPEVKENSNKRRRMQYELARNATNRKRRDWYSKSKNNINDRRRDRYKEVKERENGRRRDRYKEVKEDVNKRRRDQSKDGIKRKAALDEQSSSSSSCDSSYNNEAHKRQIYTGSAANVDVTIQTSPIHTSSDDKVDKTQQQNDAPLHRDKT
jgi:hypothetical protein